ncbi:MAG: hypothetical protein EPO02_13585 [Nitrospirae bacterium]|nr:MAG: hypothetical protein EPO02_13585 [Nitrospirota bacterium]
MALTIRKKVTLEFLGDEYKDAYLTFRAIPVSELETLLAKLPKEDAAQEEKTKSIGIMLDVLKEYFLDGKFPNKEGMIEDVTKEDMDNIDADTAIHCFQGLSGVSSNLEQESRTSSTPLTQTASPEANHQSSI